MISKKKLLPMAVSLVSLAMAAPQVMAELEEMTVTATKRAESIQDVPISISAYSGEALEDAGITDLQELGAEAPNLYLSKSSQVANTRIAVRGVGSVGNNAIEPSVAVFIDGVYYPRPGAVIGELQDIASIEVLRGPQGTLFGRNASMGALNITTKAPTQDSSADIKLGAGDFNARTFAASVNGGLSDNVAGRLSVQSSQQDGWGKSTYDNEDIGGMKDTGVRGSLAFSIGSAEARLNADWKRYENSGTVVEVKPDSVLPVYLQRLAAVLDPNLADGVGDGLLPEVTNGFDHIVHQKAGDHAKDEQSGISLDITGHWGSHTWRSVSSMRQWENTTYEDVIRLPADLLQRDTAYNTDTWSQEFQLLSDTDGDFSYVTGLYLYHEEYALAQSFNLGADFCQPTAFNSVYFQTLTAYLQNGADQGTASQAAATGATNTATACGSFAQDGAMTTDFNQEADSMAVFAQGTYDLSEDWSTTFGMRWTNDEKSGAFDQQTPNPIVGPAGLNLRAPEASELEFSDSQLTWLANVQYQANEDTMMFYSVSTGYKAGGFNSDGGSTVLGDRRIFDSEEVLSHELGLKSTLADSVTLNATLYRTNIEGFQDRLFDGLSFVVVNAGELQQQGLELDLTAQPNEHFTAQVGLSLLDSEFLSYANGTPMPGFDQTEPQDLKGTRNNISPDKTLSTSLEWRDTFSNGMAWFARGNYQYIGEQSVSAQADGNPASLEDAYSLLNARVGIESANESWEVALYGKNLGDQGYCQAAFYQPLASTLNLVDPNTGNAMTRCVTGAPKQVGVELKFHF